MDALEVLTSYGQVDPAEQSTIDDAAAAVLASPGTSRPRRSRTRWPRRTLIAAGSVAAATAVAVAGFAATGGLHRPATTHTATSPTQPSHHTSTPAPSARHARRAHHPITRHGRHDVLTRLADTVLKSPAAAGDATLVLRSQSDGTGTPIPGADLYADNGQYYYAHTESGLPAQVKEGHSQGAGVFGREVAAAKEAATGDLQQAIQAMEDAPDPSLHTTTVNADWLWENSLDALQAGAGNPTVRAGVMKLIAVLSEVSVANATVNGTPAVQLTASFPNESKCAANGIKPTTAKMKKVCASLVGGGFWEQLNLDASTGIPLSFESGPPGQKATAEITYQVSRVTLTEVANGSFAKLSSKSTSSTAGA